MRHHESVSSPSWFATTVVVVVTLIVVVVVVGPPGVGAATELRMGPYAAMVNPALLRYANDTADEGGRVSIDLNAADPTLRTATVIVTGDTFRTAAPNQFRTSAVLLSPLDDRDYIRPYGLQALLKRVASTADPESLHSLSAVTFVNTTAAFITFALAEGFDGHRGEAVGFAIDGSLLTGGRRVGGGMVLTFAGPGRTQSILWAITVAIITAAHAVFEPHGVIDCHVLIALVALPCAHSVPARVGDALWRLMAPLSFSAEPTPTTVLGSALFIAAIAGGLVVFAVLQRGSFAAAPFYFSRWWFNVVAFLVLPSNVASWLLLTRGESAALGFFGFVGLVVFSGGSIAALVAWLYVERSAARFRVYSWHRTEELHWRLLYPSGFWVDAFTETSLTLVRDAGSDSLVSTVGPTLKAVVEAIVLGTAPSNGGDCAAVYMLVAVAEACVLVSDIVLRWRRSVARTAADCAVTAGLILMAIGGSTQAVQPTLEEPRLMYGGLGIACLALAARAVHAVWLGVWERGWIDEELVRGGDGVVEAKD